MNTQALNRRQEYQEKLERYRQAFERAIQDEFPLSTGTRGLLKERQDIARLQEADVKRVEQEALDAREKALAAREAATTTATTTTTATPPPPVPEPPPVIQPATPVDVAPAASPEPPAVEGDFTEQLGNGVDLEMVKIPAGKFKMGSPDNDSEGYGDERPQHLVSVSEFWMGKYPVTQAQWEQVAALPRVKKDLDPDPSNFKGKKLPVEQVSWHDAVEFCQRLSQKTGRTYRLPSEAEWEYACRAGTTTRYYFGDTLSNSQANFGNRKRVIKEGFMGIGREEKSIGTKPVDRYSSNAFGLYNMHGNVYEWCADHWHDNYEGAPTDGSAWLSSDESNSRLLRGGSWVSTPRYCRSASRGNGTPDLRPYSNGFRVVCSAARAL
jgi:formylglycine-generating enzyme required for sulfatase activity